MRVINVDGIGFIFDEDDYEKWYPLRNRLYIMHKKGRKTLFYRTRVGGDILLRVSREIMGLKTGDKRKVYYKNGNYFDLRKENLGFFNSVTEIRKPNECKHEVDLKRIVDVNDFAKELVYLVMKDGLLVTKEEFDAKISEISYFIMQNRLRLARLRKVKLEDEYGQLEPKKPKRKYTKKNNAESNSDQDKT